MGWVNSVEGSKTFNFLSYLADVGEHNFNGAGDGARRRRHETERGHKGEVPENPQGADAHQDPPSET